MGLFENADQSVFRAYIFWSSVLVVKMLVMSFVTATHRFQKKAFVNQEDIAKTPDLKLKFDDPDVERVRRAHRNDLENILPYFVITFFYILTNPNPLVAIVLFRIVALARITHTLVYAVVVIPQPARAIAWLIPYVSSLYMAFHTIAFFV
ncbi:microsomal glutathione S-transferase 1-like [Armigeres subalbatus]|uniref:microsomal glutathione S-transferase 1-like n=1 Tax=Armigeres subalbatus TaxID=124917 RepID=UPI002ED37A29